METRDLIIEAAFIAFIDHGYGRVSLNQIIKTTGLTKGAFYHHFSSKDELIKEVMNTYFFGHIQKTMDIVGIEGQSFKERINVVFENVMNIDIRLASQPERIIERDDFLKLLWESMNLNEEMKQMNDQYQQNIIKVMTLAIESGKKEKVVKEDIDAQEIAGVLSAVVRGTILMTNQMTKNESEQMLRNNVGSLMKLIQQ
ncbi:TetR/AcrR family transcriptional regulator [Clostridium grantii]|uniref:Transcriptional regulator, TetR family n=1 Tax=Clostridium grantii DSM 8605 TaxID=1121316 RepID=A0A1M5S9I0_9CLOT|nr:TetR/AcrR family transcriptional regulator [Clostridium grantii]SHH35156.1 transcriptional regulator, TetR family [Clostridium grantii DSM 8605]